MDLEWEQRDLLLELRASPPCGLQILATNTLYIRINRAVHRKPYKIIVVIKAIARSIDFRKYPISGYKPPPFAHPSRRVQTGLRAERSDLRA